MSDKDTTTSSSDPKQDALVRLDKVIEDFKAVSAKRGPITPEQQHEYSEKLINSVESALQDGPWERSVFLRAIGTKLKTVREFFKATFSRTAIISESQMSPAQLTAKMRSQNIPDTQVEIYISLYCANGRDIKTWEKLILTMGRQIVTRPILQQEEDVRALIRSKLNQLNEAYIAVRVNKRDIITPVGGIVPKDPLGHALLTVRDGCVGLDHIIRFIHVSGEYHFHNTSLERIGDADFMLKD